MPVGEVTIFTELFRGSECQGEISGLHFIRRKYIKSSSHSNSIARKIITLRMIIFWAIELIYLCYTDRPDCIYIGQIDRVGMLGLLTKILFRIPYIVFVYGEELTKTKSWGWRRRVIEKVCLNATKTVAISQFTVTQLTEFGVNRKQIVLVPPGDDVDCFNSGIDIGDFRARLAPSDTKILLTVGRLTKRKGHAQVITVLPQVLKAAPNLRYVVAGPDWGEGENLRNLVKRIGLEKQVVFLGHISDEDIPKLYCACDVFIMANYELGHNHDTEGFGMVFLEANACGKPVIGGCAGGVPDAVVHGETGVLVDSADLEALSQVIIKLLTDEPYAKNLGIKGRDRVVKSFSWEKSASTVREVGLAQAYDVRNADH
jgi:phosphatidylinositol alpha-1,6-mannosyltransferase